jgi:hypothetical protein
MRRTRQERDKDKERRKVKLTRIGIENADKVPHLKRTIAVLAAALVVAGCVQGRTTSGTRPGIMPITKWTSKLDENCRRCVSAKSFRDTAQIPLPERAIVYSFTGEFAHKVDWWLVDLDTGEITKRESISNNAREWNTTTNHVGIVDPNALVRLRDSASTIWRSDPYNLVGWLSPGADEEDFVVSGSRLVAFSRFAPNDHFIVTAINSALPTEAAKTNGSFVVIPPRH